MDDRRGVFVSEQERGKLPAEEQKRIGQCETLAVGEIVTIKGVRFRVTDILSRGRLRMKMMLAETKA